MENENNDYIGKGIGFITIGIILIVILYISFHYAR